MTVNLSYDLDLVLAAPSGGIFEAITVAVEMQPADSSCVIFGWDEGGETRGVEVRGSQAAFELPFCQPQIFVKFGTGMTAVTLRVVSWREAA